MYVWAFTLLYGLPTRLKLTIKFPLKFDIQLPFIDFLMRESQ